MLWRPLASIAILFGYVKAAFANPMGGEVVAGQAKIAEENGDKLIITQSSDRAVIDWRGFDIAVKQHTHFVQPQDGIILNRVKSDYASKIDGRLSSTGTVIIVNPNGMIFGPQARIDVGGLIATTADIRNDAFMQGKTGQPLHFNIAGKSNSQITNQGMITVKEGGIAAFVAPHVVNDGQIQGRLNKIALAGGECFTLDMYGDDLIALDVTEHVESQSIKLNGKIDSAGGTIVVSTAKARKFVDSIIDVRGEIRATAVVEKNGIVHLVGSHAKSSSTNTDKIAKGKDIIKLTGKIDVSSASSKGGEVVVAAKKVKLTDGASIKADGKTSGGSVYIGGDYLGKGKASTADSTYTRSTIAIPTAEITHLGKNVQISANASDGDGGTVIVWADKQTDFYGSIAANGNMTSGRGGFVETSGGLLNVQNTVQARGAKSGTWLLDPYNVTISSGATTNAGSSPNYSATATGSVVNVSNITSALAGGTSVTVSTGASGAEAGNITVANSISTAVGGAGTTLTLKAASSIIINAGVSIASTSGQLNIVLNADSGGSGSGAIYGIGSSGSPINITSQGGNITLGGGGDPTTGFAYGNSTSNHGITTRYANITAGGGNIIMNGQAYNNTGGNGMEFLDGNNITTTGSGSITLKCNGTTTGSSGSCGMYLYSSSGSYPVAFTTVNGNISITAVASLQAASGGEGLFLANNVTISSSGTGNVTIAGTGSSTSTSANGVNAYTGASIYTTDGALSITGIAVSGSSNLSSSCGVQVSNASVQAKGTGSITLNGTSSSNSGTSLSGTYIFNSSVKALGNGTAKLYKV